MSDDRTPLLGKPLIVVQAGISGAKLRPVAGRDAHCVALGDVQLPFENLVRESGVQLAKLLRGAPGELGDGRESQVVLGFDLLVLETRLELHVPEVLLVVTLDLQGGEKLGVEVAGREPERLPVVVVDDLHDVRGIELLDGARDTGATVIVRGDRQRPRAERIGVVAQMTSGAQRGIERIAPRILDRVQAQINARGGGDELPDARRTYLGVRVNIEARFDERQARQLDGQAFTPKDVFHGREVAARNLEPALEALPHSLLRADSLASLSELSRSVDVAEHLPDGALPLVEVVRGKAAAGQTRQRGIDSVELLLLAAMPLAPQRLIVGATRGQRAKIDHGVNFV